MAFFTSFGIEWSHLVAQLINFGILVFVLYKLVYKPILKVLDERITQAKDTANKESSIEARLAEIDASKEKILAGARSRGEKLVKESEAASTKLAEKLSSEAKKSAEKIVRDAEARMQSENEKLKEDFKKEALNIVAEALENTVGKYLTADATKKLAEEAAHEAMRLEKHIK